MRRTSIVPLAAAALLLPGCIVVGGRTEYDYAGYGAVEKTVLDTIIQANTQNRPGEPQDTVLARFPAEHVSLVHSSIEPDGDEVAVYRVYARSKSTGTRFERYLLFEDGRLALLTDDRDELPRAQDPDLAE